MNSKNYVLFSGVLIVMCSLICIERIKEMNNHTEQKTGHLLAQDRDNQAVKLEWFKTNIVSQDFADAMKSVWSVARDAYISVEMDFLKAFPEVVGAEPYFVSFEPLFANGIVNVDWMAAEKTMETILKGHFVFDPSQFPKQVIELFGQDTCYFVEIKEQATDKILGFITFLMRPNYTAGDIKVMSFAVDTGYQKRGLGKLLMSSIFKVVPNVKRIFLCTRVTNITALNAYRAWGFVIDEKPVLDHAFNLNHWTFMEYKTDQSDVLQRIAARLE